MHKDKQGKVFASLTEVKNKTGDIFALVDEFGEVFITSYNKTRYKISKMDISGILKESKDEEVETPKDIKVKRTKTVVVEKEKVETEIEKKDEDLKPLNIAAYDRNNDKELNFVRNALQPLVNN